MCGGAMGIIASSLDCCALRKGHHARTMAAGADRTFATGRNGQSATVNCRFGGRDKAIGALTLGGNSGARERHMRRGPAGNAAIA